MKFNPLDPLGNSYDEWRPSKLNCMDGDGDTSGDGSGSSGGGFDGGGDSFGDFGSGFGDAVSGGFDGPAGDGGFGFGDATGGSFGGAVSGGFDGPSGDGGFGFGDATGGGFGGAVSGGFDGPSGDGGFGFGDATGGGFGGAVSGGFDGPAGDFGGGGFFGDGGGVNSGFGFDDGGFFGPGVDNLASNDLFGNFFSGGPDNFGNFDTFDSFGPAGWESTFGNNMQADWGLSPGQAEAQSFGWGPGDYAAYAGMSPAGMAPLTGEPGFNPTDMTGRGAPSFDESGFIGSPFSAGQVVTSPGFQFDAPPVNPAYLNASPFDQTGRSGMDMEFNPFSVPEAPGQRGEGPQDPAAASAFAGLLGISPANANAGMGAANYGQFFGPSNQTANELNTQTLDAMRAEAGLTPGLVAQGLQNAQQQIADERAEAEFNQSLSGAVPGMNNANAVPTITGSRGGPDLGDLYNTGRFTDPTGGANNPVAMAFQNGVNDTPGKADLGVTPASLQDAGRAALQAAFDQMGIANDIAGGRTSFQSPTQTAPAPASLNDIFNTGYVGGGTPAAGPFGGALAGNITGQTNPNAAPSWANNVTAGLDFSPAAVAMTQAAAPANAVSIAGGRGDFNNVFADVTAGNRGADVALPAVTNAAPFYNSEVNQMGYQTPGGIDYAGSAGQAGQQGGLGQTVSAMSEMGLSNTAIEAIVGNMSLSDIQSLMEAIISGQISVAEVNAAVGGTFGALQGGVQVAGLDPYVGVQHPAPANDPSTPVSPAVPFAPVAPPAPAPTINPFNITPGNFFAPGLDQVLQGTRFNG